MKKLAVCRVKKRRVVCGMDAISDKYDSKKNERRLHGD